MYLTRENLKLLKAIEDEVGLRFNLSNENMDALKQAMNWGRRSTVSYRIKSLVMEGVLHEEMDDNGQLWILVDRRYGPQMNTGTRAAAGR